MIKRRKRYLSNRMTKMIVHAMELNTPTVTTIQEPIIPKEENFGGKGNYSYELNGRKRVIHNMDTFYEIAREIINKLAWMKSNEGEIDIGYNGRKFLLKYNLISRNKDNISYLFNIYNHDNNQIIRTYTPEMIGFKYGYRYCTSINNKPFGFNEIRELISNIHKEVIIKNEKHIYLYDDLDEMMFHIYNKNDTEYFYHHYYVLNSTQNFRVIYNEDKKEWEIILI